ncbi:MAG TPA: hypothetical protein VM925_15160 [Labilithrix sp.]|nr:hypothetical protein [Labilithrix sp.]
MASFSRVTAALLVLLGSLSIAPSARADDTLTRLRETLKKEPKAPDVVRMALDYYRVSPEAMESLRSSARSRGLVPVVSGFIGYNSTGTSSAQAQTITSPQNIIVNAAQSATVFTGGLAWDLRELVFNAAELQTYASVPMQKDLTLEVIRAYYLRRQLQIRLALRPPTDPLAAATLELRQEEYTGLLNAMTGGGFQRMISAASQPQ